MITKDHISLHSDLFEMANEFLGLKPDDDGYIRDIGDYFEHLSELITENSNPIFAILPADEEIFEIRANTREIIVPETFKKGASIIGDEVAETIYFSIDRYFDITDFFTEEIIPIVQWEITVNGKKTSGYSATTPRTIDFIPDKVVFGWPLSSEITQSAGDVSFNVRFYEVKDDELVYSFSTLSSVIKIRNSLCLDVVNNTVDKVDKTNLIWQRVRSSSPSNPLFKAVEPLLDNAPYVGNMYPKFDSKNTYDLVLDESTGEKFLMLVAKGCFEDGTPLSQIGQLKYSWFRVDAQGSRVELNFDENDFVDVYLKTDDVVDNSTEVYYTLNEDGSYEKADFDYNFDEIKDNFYEKAVGVKIDKGGEYYLEITNFISSGNKETLEIKEPIIISLPSKVDFKNNKEEAYHAIIEEDGAVLSLAVNNPDGDSSVMYYQWIDENDIASELSETMEYTVNTPGSYRLRVENEKNNDRSAVSVSDPIIVTYPASVPVVSKYMVGRYDLSSNNPIPLYLDNIGDNVSIVIEDLVNSDSITYQWYKNDVAINGAISNTYNLGSNFKVGDYFYCKVTNIYNVVSEVTVISNNFLVQE